MNPPDARPATGNSRRAPAGLSVAAFTLTVVFVVACRQVAGISLGLFFGAVGAATLLVPPLAAAAHTRGFASLLVPVATTLGAAVVWAFTPVEVLTWGQWFACTFVLMAYGVALVGVVVGAISLRAPSLLAAGAVTILGLLWLTWPVWLSHALLTTSGDTLVDWLVPAHPLFAINGALIHFDAWDRLPLAYTELSNLNQDVFYTLPRGVGPAVFVHLLVGVFFATCAMLIERHRQSNSNSAAASPVEARAGGAPAGR